MCLSFNLALPWTEQSPPSLLAHFNDKKTIKKTPKTCQKLISTFAMVLDVPIELKGINYYSKVF